MCPVHRIKRASLIIHDLLVLLPVVTADWSRSAYLTSAKWIRFSPSECGNGTHIHACVFAHTHWRSYRLRVEHYHLGTEPMYKQETEQIGRLTESRMKQKYDRDKTSCREKMETEEEDVWIRGRERRYLTDSYPAPTRPVFLPWVP